MLPGRPWMEVTKRPKCPPGTVSKLPAEGAGSELDGGGCKHPPFSPSLWLSPKDIGLLIPCPLHHVEQCGLIWDTHRGGVVEVIFQCVGDGELHSDGSCGQGEGQGGHLGHPTWAGVSSPRRWLQVGTPIVPGIGDRGSHRLGDIPWVAAQPHLPAFRYDLPTRGGSTWAMAMGFL